VTAPGHIKVIILAGGRDFGRDPLAVDLPTALWPVVGKPALQRLLDSLADQGVGDVVVCSNGQSSILAESVQPDRRSFRRVWSLNRTSKCCWMRTASGNAA